MPVRGIGLLMAGIYIHIPFCASKCGYCDFYSCTRLELRDAVLAEIGRELEAERGFLGNAPLRTIYFGGGTPSVCTPEQLQEVIDRVRGLWDCSGVEEITVEANPDDLTPEWLHALAATDVNRLSIGVQSFIDRDLRLMNRRHTARAAIDAVGEAQRAGFGNITVDLIYGIPGMSLAEWWANIETALGLGVQHISAYHLTIEDTTPFGRQAAAGQLTPIDERASEEQYLLLHAMLTAAGFEHYEISNFARPGFRALHNSSYWTGEPYLGAGPSAHSFDGRVRRNSPPSVDAYLADRAGGYITETLTAADRYNEFVMTSLRTAEGIDMREMERRFGAERATEFEISAQPHLASGLLIRQGYRWFIPPEKYLVSDAVISELFLF